MKFFLPLLLLFASIASAQKVLKVDTVTDHSIHIIGNNFEGLVFTKNYFQRPEDTAERKIKRFTPTSDDITSAESFLQIQKRNKKSFGDEKYIFNHLSNYRRQYIGYFDDKGDKIIYVNCFPVNEDWANKKVKNNGENIPTWYSTLFFVFDGGRSFWQVHINITKKKLVSMSINGVA